MKKLLTTKIVGIIILLLTSINSFAQEDETVEELKSQIKIDMNFDKTLYPLNEGNMFYSNEPKAVIVAVDIPQKYEDMKNELNNDSDAEDLKDVKKGEFEEAGKKVIYFTGIMTDEDGKEVFMEILVKKATESSCIMITSLYDINAKEKFKKEARKAILSAKIVQ